VRLRDHAAFEPREAAVDQRRLDDTARQRTDAVRGELVDVAAGRRADGDGERACSLDITLTAPSCALLTMTVGPWLSRR